VLVKVAVFRDRQTLQHGPKHLELTANSYRSIWMRWLTAPWSVRWNLTSKKVK